MDVSIEIYPHILILVREHLHIDCTDDCESIQCVNLQGIQQGRQKNTLGNQSYSKRGFVLLIVVARTFLYSFCFFCFVICSLRKTGRLFISFFLSMVSPSLGDYFNFSIATESHLCQ